MPSGEHPIRRSFARRGFSPGQPDNATGIFYYNTSTIPPNGFLSSTRLRSYLGYPPVRDARPNPTHFAIAALQHTSTVRRLITQNVDGLHHKSLSGIWSPARIAEGVLELHGTLHVSPLRCPSKGARHSSVAQRVRCRRGHTVERSTFQDWLSAANLEWNAFVAELERTGQKPRTNPDGDVSA
jgi:NAD-dependent deacetylase sirtuin 4